MINSHRLIVRGHRIPYNPIQLEKENKKALHKKLIRVAIAVLIAILLIGLITARRRRARRKHEGKGKIKNK